MKRRSRKRRIPVVGGSYGEALVGRTVDANTFAFGVTVAMPSGGRWARSTDTEVYSRAAGW